MPLSNSLLVLLLLLNLLVLGTSRIRSLVQAVAFQGVILSVLTIALEHHLRFHIVLVCVLTVIIKSSVIPTMLSRAMRELPIRREVEPLVGLGMSMILGAAGTGLAVAFAYKLPLAGSHVGSLLVPAALSTVFTGFLVLTTRMKAITQVIGYLILENGIFIFGLLLLEAMPLLVELGVLLDLFVGIFVMGIIIGHINREFASVNTELLSALKE